MFDVCCAVFEAIFPGQPHSSNKAKLCFFNTGSRLKKKKSLWQILLTK